MAGGQQSAERTISRRGRREQDRIDVIQADHAADHQASAPTLDHRRQGEQVIAIGEHGPWWFAVGEG